MEIKNGSPVILHNARDMKKYGLKDGMKGFVNAVVDLGQEGIFAFFMPDDEKKSFVINVERLEFDQERYEEMNGV